MAKIPKLGSLHTVRINDDAYFHIQKKTLNSAKKGLC